MYVLFAIKVSCPMTQHYDSGDSQISNMYSIRKVKKKKEKNKSNNKNAMKAQVVATTNWWWLISALVVA